MSIVTCTRVVLLFVTALRMTSAAADSQAADYQFIVGIYVPRSAMTSPSLLRVIGEVWGQHFNATTRLPSGKSVKVKHIVLQQQFEHSLEGVSQATRSLKEESVSVVIGYYDVILKLVTSAEQISYIVLDCPTVWGSDVTSGEGVYYGGGTLYMLPPCGVVHDAAVDVATSFGWDEAVVLYDSVEGLNIARALMTSPGMLVGAWPLHSTESQVLNQLLTIRSQSIRNILVVCSTELLANLLNGALRLSMLSDRYSWIYVSLNGRSVNFMPFLYTQVNFTTFSLYSFDDRLRYRVIKDGSDDPRKDAGPSASSAVILPYPPSSPRPVFGDVTSPSNATDALLLSLVNDALDRLSTSLPVLYEPASRGADCPPFCASYMSVNASHHINIIKLVSRQNNESIVYNPFTNVPVNTTLRVLSLTQHGLEEIGVWKEGKKKKVPTATLR